MPEADKRQLCPYDGVARGDNPLQPRFPMGLLTVVTHFPFM